MMTELQYKLTELINNKELTVNKPLSENEKTVLNYLYENEVIISRVIKEITGLSATSSRDLINRLIKKGFVVATDEKKNRKYHLIRK